MVAYFLSHSHFVVIDIVEEVFVHVNSIYMSHYFWACLKEGEAFVCCILHSPTSINLFLVVVFPKEATTFELSLWGGGFYLCWHLLLLCLCAQAGDHWQVNGSSKVAPFLTPILPSGSLAIQRARHVIESQRCIPICQCSFLCEVV